MHEGQPSNPQTKVYVDSLAPSAAPDRGSSHGLMLELIGSNKRVLEFGCATGYMSARMQDAGCRVTAVESDPVMANAARQYCEAVIVEDLDFRPLDQILPRTVFDVLVFGDVLEHLRDPWRVLDESRPYIAPGGYAVFSIPNVAHASVRLALLRGEFDYSKTGLLDDTHLRFFTRTTVEELCTRAGFAIDRMERTRAPLFAETDITPYGDEFDTDERVAAEIARDPDHDTIQFVFTAFPLSDERKFANAIERMAAANARVLRAEAAARRAALAHDAAEAEVTRQQQTIDVLRVGLETERALRANVVSLTQAEADPEVREQVRAICREVLALGATVDVYASDPAVSGVTADAAVARARANAEKHVGRAERAENDLLSEQLRSAQLADEREAAAAECAELRGRLSEIENRLSRAEAVAEGLRAEAVAAAASAASRETALRAELEAASERQSALESELEPYAALRSKFAESQAVLAARDAEIAARGRRIAELDSDREAIRSALAALTGRLTLFLEGEVAATHARIADTAAAIAAIQASKPWRLKLRLRKLLRRN